MNNSVITPSDVNVRIDVYLAGIYPELSRSYIAKLFNDGNITVNDKKVSKSYKLRLNDCVIIDIPEPVEYSAKPENIPIDIVYEDNDIIIVNKQKGMVVHPANGNYDKTLVNALLYHCGDSLSGINGVMRPGIVHRIDKNTSGLLIVAKNDNAHKILADQIKEHSFTREYEAVVYGNFKDECGTVDAPIGRHPVNRKQMCVTASNSKNAVTHWRVINQYSGFTHLKLRLETGRTHQIRVHMSHIGHPVLGDDVYCTRKNPYKFLIGQCLHAKNIGFIHPSTNNFVQFDSDLPDYFLKVLKDLKEV